MRKISSKHSERKKQKRNQMILGAILIIVMFGSVFGIIVNSFGTDDSDQEKEVNYNGFVFSNQNGKWLLNLGEAGILGFVYNPYQVEDINAEIDNFAKYSSKPLYISSYNDAANLEVYNNLGRFALRIQEACFEGQECSENLPVKTCEDNFIIIKENNKSDIKQDQNCVVIEGSETKITQITDEFLFKTFGIKE